MNKAPLLSFFVLFYSFLWAASPARPPRLFQDDLSSLEEHLAGVTQLETEVELRHATYAQLALEHNGLLNYVSTENTNISAVLLDASIQTDKSLKNALIVFGAIGLLSIGACFLSFYFGSGH